MLAAKMFRLWGVGSAESSKLAADSPTRRIGKILYWLSCRSGPGAAFPGELPLLPPLHNTHQASLLELFPIILTLRRPRAAQVHARGWHIAASGKALRSGGQVTHSVTGLLPNFTNRCL